MHAALSPVAWHKFPLGDRRDLRPEDERLAGQAPVLVSLTYDTTDAQRHGVRRHEPR